MHGGYLKPNLVSPLVSLREVQYAKQHQIDTMGSRTDVTDRCCR